MRICTCAIPGVAIVVAWILIAMGKAADYDSGDAVMDNNHAKKPEQITDE